MCTVPVLADTPTRFFDQQGNLLTDMTLTAIEKTGGQRFNAQPDGIFVLNAQPGDKVELQLSDPFTRYVPVHGMVPVDLAPGETWDIVVTPAGGPANDDCANATPANLNGLTAGTTIGATTVDRRVRAGRRGDGVAVAGHRVPHTR